MFVEKNKKKFKLFKYFLIYGMFILKINTISNNKRLNLVQIWSNGISVFKVCRKI